jgi:hypothetical protein
MERIAAAWAAAVPAAAQALIFEAATYLTDFSASQ